MTRRVLPAFCAALLLLPPGSFSQENGAPAPVAPSDEAVKRIGETRFRLGEVEFDAETREVFVPAAVNMREGGPMEYILVHEQGKVHESILTTKARPLHVRIALELLRYEAGHGDIFHPLLPEELIAEEGGTAAERGDAVDVVFRWQENGEDRSSPVAAFIVDRQRAEPMAVEPWVVTGSVSEGGTFMAEAEGSILAVYLDRFALLNMTRQGAEFDERWGGNGELVPPLDTRGVLVIAPAGSLIEP